MDPGGQAVMNKYGSREKILVRIRAGKPESLPLPAVPLYSCPGNPVENFITHLLNFDGKAIKFRTRDDAVAWLGRQEETNASTHVVYSTAAGVKGSIDEKELADLRNGSKIEACIAEGAPGVGEMGSIWVTDQSLGKPACALLSRKLFIFLDSARIVNGLHEAYAAIKLGENQYGSFYAGPSATADIEAVHITGAQGPIALTVLLYNCEDAEEPPKLLISPNADSSPWQKFM